MSSKKIYTSVGLDELVLKKWTEECLAESRSRSNLLEMILRMRYRMPGVENIEVKINAHQA